MLGVLTPQELAKGYRVIAGLPPLPPERQLLNIYQCTSAAGGPEAHVGGDGNLTEGGVSTGVKVKLAEHADVLNMKSEIKT